MRKTTHPSLAHFSGRCAWGMDGFAASVQRFSRFSASLWATTGRRRRSWSCRFHPLPRRRALWQIRRHYWFSSSRRLARPVSRRRLIGATLLLPALPLLFCVSIRSLLWFNRFTHCYIIVLRILREICSFFFFYLIKVLFENYVSFSSENLITMWVYHSKKISWCFANLSSTTEMHSTFSQCFSVITYKNKHLPIGLSCRVKLKIRGVVSLWLSKLVLLHVEVAYHKVALWSGGLHSKS